MSRVDTVFVVGTLLYFLTGFGVWSLVDRTKEAFIPKELWIGLWLIVPLWPIVIFNEVLDRLGKK